MPADARVRPKGRRTHKPAHIAARMPIKAFKLPRHVRCQLCDNPRLPGRVNCAACRVILDRIAANHLNDRNEGLTSEVARAVREARIQVYAERAARNAPLFEGLAWPAWGTRTWPTPFDTE